MPGTHLRQQKLGGLLMATNFENLKIQSLKSKAPVQSHNPDANSMQHGSAAIQPCAVNVLDSVTA